MPMEALNYDGQDDAQRRQIEDMIKGILRDMGTVQVTTTKKVTKTKRIGQKLSLKVKEQQAVMTKVEDQSYKVCDLLFGEI